MESLWSVFRHRVAMQFVALPVCLSVCQAVCLRLNALRACHSSAFICLNEYTPYIMCSMWIPHVSVGYMGGLLPATHVSAFTLPKVEQCIYSTFNCKVMRIFPWHFACVNAKNELTCDINFTLIYCYCSLRH